MLVSDLIKRYEEFCPQDLSMEGDISGLQIGSLNKEVKRVMLALDIREQTVAEAIEKQVDLIIVKHAPIFRPLKDLVADRAQNKILLDLVKQDIGVYVSHTNIDVVENGLNDWFCQLLEIKNPVYLKETQPGYGIGRVGDIAPQTVGEFAAQVKRAFGLDSLRLVAYDKADLERVIERIAICGGSGQSFYPDVIQKGAQLYLTGDIYYHTAQEMLSEGLLALDPGHYIEVLFVEKLAQKLGAWAREENWPVEVLASQASTKPFQEI
ncbi:Nif3-like dinuclear metal center hexameric protein [Streptococcus oricebi]|uniref:GTP cyclohydrolase 1 type 2 homolog n=1 Tax=Streptococcus oricebi TaxID=1547447 RepID=A0ABS5B2A4_9STRE|nr:Nif3-like dinuclear metal center hexameric protein [Streptococcus oricebi]MBP2622959.1 Nif3-like dinuclear metal center hexameric protein [Streptococcus oricebi]